MSTNPAAHLVNLPTEITFKIFNSLDNVGEQKGLERAYNYGYPKATVLGRPGIRADPKKRLLCRFDAISRCCKRLRVLSFPYLFRCLKVNVAEEQSAINMLQLYLNSNWILRYTRRLYFIMDIRTIIVAELPISVMRPNLNVLMNMVARFFQCVGGVEELHFIVKSEIVSNGLRRVFRRPRQQIETSLSNVRSLKFSAGSEWIIRFCGGYSGLQELENSPGVSGRLYVPYSIDFAREYPHFSIEPTEELFPTTALSRIGDYRAANIMKGITSLRKGTETLTKVTIYGKFTTDGLNVFIKCIPVVSYLTIIGGPTRLIRGVIESNHAHVLGQLPYLRLLSFEGDLEHPREKFEACPETLGTLWHFARCIRTLQQMWVAARFVGEIVRDTRGYVFIEHTAWKDTWADSNIQNSDSGDVQMGGSELIYSTRFTERM